MVKATPAAKNAESPRDKSDVAVVSTKRNLNGTYKITILVALFQNNSNIYTICSLGVI